MWIPPEKKDPILKHYPNRKSVGYFGALRIRDGKFHYNRELESFNAQTFWKFIKKIRRISSRSKRKVVVVIDNAKYHHAILHKDWRSKTNHAFELLFMPPYSPELNPIERVWKVTRRLCTHNQFFSKIQNISDVIEKQFDFWRYPNETLRKLCAI